MKGLSLFIPEVVFGLAMATGCGHAGWEIRSCTVVLHLELTTGWVRAANKYHAGKRIENITRTSRRDFWNIMHFVSQGRIRLKPCYITMNRTKSHMDTC